ncbi:MAG TPA: MarR family transcriptional regulator [Acidimicrobiales bacterium]|nr:MarR family transcriptional regulator [Acidimicrobiales bacterium]
MRSISATATASDTASRLRLAVARLARLLRQQSTEGEITVSMLSALASVERLGPVALGELAAVERVQPPSLTRIVGRLEELGLVARAADPADRRIVRVSPTPEGTRLLARNRRRRDAFLAERMQLLNPDEVAAVEAALPVLERLLEGDR